MSSNKKARKYTSKTLQELIDQVTVGELEITSKSMKPLGPKAEAQDLVLSFYYKLPNNGSLKTGINSCESRFKEAVMCALVCINHMIKIAPWGGDIDGEIEDSSKEYYMKVKEEIEKL